MTCLTKLPVDPPYQFIHDGAQILIFFHVLSTWDSNLDQNDLSNPFRMAGEKDLQGMQLLWDTLDIVKTIHADHQLNSMEFVF